MEIINDVNVAGNTVDEVGGDTLCIVACSSFCLLAFNATFLAGMELAAMTLAL